MSHSDHEAFTPARRRLCPDGACIGLLDDAGRCKVCDRSTDGKQRADASPPADAAAQAAPRGDQAFDPKRTLCPDGACVGVLADGRCRLCGRTEGDVA